MSVSAKAVPCQEFCHQWNSWLKADTYFWIETLITTSSISEWKATVTVECTEALSGFAQEVENAKALRAYACDKGIRLQDVTLEKISKTTLGIKGYSELYERMPGAAPRLGGGGSNTPPPPAPPPSNKRRQGVKDSELEEVLNQGADVKETKDPKDNNNKRPKRDQTQSKKEKEVKELLAMEQSADNTMATISSDIVKDGKWWAWSSEAVKNYKDTREEVLRKYTKQPAFQQMKVAALSPRETAKLKKDLADQYVAHDNARP